MAAAGWAGVADTREGVAADALLTLTLLLPVPVLVLVLGAFLTEPTGAAMAPGRLWPNPCPWLCPCA